MLLLSCPGSGKTTTLLLRISGMVARGIRPEEILMVTFTRAAAEEMKKRHAVSGGASGVTFLTIHSLCLRILTEEGRYTASDILSDSDRNDIVFRALRGRPDVPDAGEMTERMLTAISVVKNSRLDPYGYSPPRCSSDLFRHVWDAYEEERGRAHKIDCDDMMLEALALLENDPAVLARWQGRYTHIQCDEYQDVNLIQKEILYLLAGEAQNFCAAGDDDQAIYGFRGGDPLIMIGFTEDFPSAKVVRIGTNYRCAGSIVDAAGLLIKDNRTRLEKEFVSARGRGGIAGSVELHYNLSKDLQYEDVIRIIKERHSAGRPYEDMAILYRTNDLAADAADALTRAGIPFSSAKQIRSIYEGWIFKIIKSYMYLGLGCGGRDCLMYVLNRPNRYLRAKGCRDIDMGRGYTVDGLMRSSGPADGKPAWQRSAAQKSISDWISAFGRGTLTMDTPPEEVFKRLETKIGIRGYIQGLDLGRDTGGEFLRTYDRIRAEALKYGTLREWSAHVRGDIDRMAAASRSTDGVRLSTMHGAKGLEWGAVFIVDADDYVIPAHGEDEEEERRLFYVAMTRARDELYIMSSAMACSPFMSDLDRAMAAERGRAFTEKARVGDRCRHKTFGYGVIVGMEGDRMKIEFDGQTKTFQTSCAASGGLLQVLPPL